MERKLAKLVLVAVFAIGLTVTTADARTTLTTLKSICRVKGQEENTLHGLGIVVGLNGTGDGGNFLPTIRSLAIAMELMGTPIGENGAAELKDAKNVALVTVTATVPAAGARQGDKTDCVVSSGQEPGRRAAVSDAAVGARAANRPCVRSGRRSHYAG